MGADLIEEVAVVGYHDDRIGKAEQEVFQPGNGLQVQVVGRFVQQQHIRVAEQGLGQEHPHLVASLKLLHLLFTEFLGNAEAIQKYRRFGFGLVTIYFGKLGFQFARTNAIRLAEVTLGVECLPFDHYFIEMFMPHDDRVEDGLLVIGELVLLEDRDTLPGADADRPRVRVNLACQDFQEG